LVVNYQLRDSRNDWAGDYRPAGFGVKLCKNEGKRAISRRLVIPKILRIFLNFPKFLLTWLVNVLIFVDMARKLLSTSCPCCGLPMQTAAMACPTCGVKVEGSFSQTHFDKLSPEDQKFLEEYLLAGFSIKTLEQRSSLGYAAIRSRLDRLIANYEALKKMDAQKKAVLEQLRAGEISVAEAREKIERISGD